MATWIAHLRIAEILLEKYDFDPECFLAGSIGPDSGVPDVSRTRFDPPKRITHWMAGDENIGRNIRSEEFRSKYLAECSGPVLGDPRRSFLLGYYVHLLTDIEWSNMVHIKMEEDAGSGRRLAEDPEFIREVKRDWYGLDFKYLKENPGNIFATVFVKIDNMPDYLDYFPEGAVMRQIRHIQDFYRIENDWVSKDFTYLREADMDSFIYETSLIVTERLDRIL